MNPPALFSKTDVIACLGIKKSEFAPLLKKGIIPAPVGREGNAHRWNSRLIQAIALSMKTIGEDHTCQVTIDLMLKQLVALERKNLKLSLMS
jgi:hypothetical protein